MARAFLLIALVDLPATVAAGLRGGYIPGFENFATPRSGGGRHDQAIGSGSTLMAMSPADRFRPALPHTTR